MAKIGFIGLGHMGLPMATNLLRAGHEVCGFDLQPKATQALCEHGGSFAKDYSELAEHQDIIFTMLQTGAQVKSVYIDNKLFEIANPNTLFIDCSSIDVQSAKELHQEASCKQLVFLEAPVSGGVAGAQAGTLTFMVAGNEGAFDKAQPILSCIGKTIIFTGGPGSGQAAKICNNMILGTTMVAVSEAFLLAKGLGLDAKKLHEVVTHASGDCWVMNRYVPVPDILDNVPANHQYQAGFTSAMMLKDLKLSQESALLARVSTPLAKQTMAIYQALNDSGMAELDFSAVIKQLA